MCGICGKLMLDDFSEPIDRGLLLTMMNSIRHRGPDDQGTYFSGPVGLGHLRLSIIDLSSGKQPISNEDGSVWIVFNGEIYNYKELTTRLVNRGHKFRTASDTEVIVHLYEEFGEDCVTKLRGMFSFAIWDDRNKELFVARDRVGIKPLYYHLNSRALIFASEIKAILADPSVSSELDPAALGTFLTYLYTPGEKSAFKNIYKLKPGHCLTVKNGKVSFKQYWDLRFQQQSSTKTLADSMDELVELLGETVRDHMISDVPVGVLLSGGVDSTAMLSFAVEQAGTNMSSFTIGFESDLCTDERPFARMAAEKYGSLHHEMTIAASDFLDFLPKYVWHMEEPVCEPPAIALYYVSKLAKQHGIKVLISGEGGDEAFAGYQNYRNLVWLERIKRALGKMAGPASTAVAAMANINGLGRLAKYAPLMTVPLEEYYLGRTSNPFAYFSQSRAELLTPEFLSQVNLTDPANLCAEYFASAGASNQLNQMLYVDTKTWLPDDLLIKADKMTMANSLELRVPLLDHKILEFAAALPLNYKLKCLTTKYILKKALASRVPKEIRNRKKTGFPVPYVPWLKHDLKDAVWSILMDPRSIQRGYFRRAAVEQLINSNANGHDFSKEIFSLITLELWHRMFVDREELVRPNAIPQLAGLRSEQEL
jgi:asparagine synthase (glutamine-hydrolysing)